MIDNNQQKDNLNQTVESARSDGNIDEYISSKQNVGDKQKISEVIKEILPTKYNVIKTLSLMALICVLIIIVSGGATVLNLFNSPTSSIYKPISSSQSEDYEYETKSNIYNLKSTNEVIQSALFKQVQTENNSYVYNMNGILKPQFAQMSIYTAAFASIPLSSMGSITYTQNGNFDVLTNNKLMGELNFDINKISDNIFFRLNSVPVSLLSIVGIEEKDFSTLLNKWVYVSDRKNVTKKSSVNQNAINSLISEIVNDASIQDTYPLIDQLNNKKMLKVTIDQNTTDFDKLINNTNAWYFTNTGSYLYFSDDEIKFSDVFNNVKVVLWISEESYTLQKINISGSYSPVLDSNTSGVNILQIKSVNFNIDVNFSEAEKVTTEIPTNFDTYDQYIKKISGVIADLLLFGQRDSLFNQFTSDYLLDDEAKVSISDSQRLIDYTKVMQAIMDYQSECGDFPISLYELGNANKPCNTKSNYFGSINFDPYNQTNFYYEKYSDRAGFSLCTNFSSPQDVISGYMSNVSCPNKSFNTHFSTDMFYTTDN